MRANRLGALLLAGCSLVAPLSAQPQKQATARFADVQNRITEFTLSNGMKFIVMERHQAPVAAFYTYADVGSSQERAGALGAAHMIEHMAFKGTTKIGTKSYEEEKNSLARVDQTWHAFKAERDKGAQADQAKVKQLEQEFRAAMKGADQFVVRNEFGKILEEAGGQGLNASTAMDKTDYMVSLPSNASELWFYLESERFRDPVFREFYRERDVVAEERRMRVDSNPIGKMVERFLDEAYEVHPYGRSGIGSMAEILNYDRADAEAMFRKFYVPSNLTTVIVGDVDPKQIRQFADTYFGRLPQVPKPQTKVPDEPPQKAERRFSMQLAAQRVLLMGYHRPPASDPDDAVYDVISSVLSEGRSSRLQRALVQDKQVATQAAGFSGFPGQKYENLFLFFAFTAPGKTNADVEKAMADEIERLKTQSISTEELEGVKTRARVGLINLFKSNMGMAQTLASYQVLTGNWRNMFTYLDKLEKVTPADIQRVARKTFTAQNRTVGTIEPAQAAAAQQ